MKMRFHWGVVAWCSALGTFLSVVSLALLPARTSQHTSVSADAAYVAPNREGFQLGPLRWELRDYANDPKLEPLRRFFSEHCRGTVGLPAARCLTSQMAQAFPHGAPKKEFVDAAYDPVADLQAHMAGEPGHCVTRSGLVSAILLSSGLPARQLQIIPADFHGHNVVEVFDSRWGWVLFDPTYGTVFEGEKGPISAREALVTGTAGHWSERAPAVSQALYYVDGFRAQDLVYPDPWLYVRSGTRATSWPFRALLVHTGEPVWQYGPAQGIFRQCAVFLALATLGAAFAARQRRSSRAIVTRATEFQSPIAVPASAAVDAQSASPEDLEPHI